MDRGSSKKLKIGLNGFGRIGRGFLRTALGSSRLAVVAVNDVAPHDSLVYLLKHDSLYGKAPFEVGLREGKLLIEEREITLFRKERPRDLPWREIGVDIVLEASGGITAKEKIVEHLEAGAPFVLVSSSFPEADATLCMGVNHEAFDPERHKIISGASCIGCCLAPLSVIIHRHFGFASGRMVVVHPVTSDQPILDSGKPDRRKSRSALLSSIPLDSSAPETVERILPDLKGKLGGMVIRVPTASVSSINLIASVEKKVTREKLLKILEREIEENFRGILAVSGEDLVSIDYTSDTHSLVIDRRFTEVTGKNMINIFGWFDNETGYIQRLVELLEYLSGKL